MAAPPPVPQPAPVSAKQLIYNSDLTDGDLINPTEKKFRGRLSDVIALVDSRHDFKGVSQDAAIQVKVPGKPDEYDCFRQFSANIQRIVLGIAPDYSTRLTANKCSGEDIMVIGPEKDFLDLTNRLIMEYPQCGITKVEINATVAMGAKWTENNGVIAKAYNDYHKAIAEALGYPVAGGGAPIPLVVDTTQTLSHNSYPYFMVCRNREHVADPSFTSQMKFDIVGNEIDVPGLAGERQYKINNVIHRIYGTLEEPKIDYYLGVPNDLDVPVALNNERLQGLTKITYNYGGTNTQPNEISACILDIKNNIAKAVKKTDPPSTFQRIEGINQNSLVGKMKAKFDFCKYYDKIKYKGAPPGAANAGPINDDVKKNISIPYIAKRGGDQLQAESCKEPMRFNLFRKYRIEGQRGGVTYDLLSTGRSVSVNNCVFWTCDRVAACYAILHDITTVLQFPTKNVFIYKKQGYNPTVTLDDLQGAPLIWKNALAQTIPPVPNRATPAGIVYGGVGKPHSKPGNKKYSVRDMAASKHIQNVKKNIEARRNKTRRNARQANINKTRKSTICTREKLQLILKNHVPINDNCFLLGLQYLCDFTSEYYQPWTLFNMLFYYFSINKERYNDIYENLNSMKNNMYISDDNCIITKEIEKSYIPKPEIIAAIAAARRDAIIDIAIPDTVAATAAGNAARRDAAINVAINAFISSLAAAGNPTARTARNSIAEGNAAARDYAINTFFNAYVNDFINKNNPAAHAAVAAGNAAYHAAINAGDNHATANNAKNNAIVDAIITITGHNNYLASIPAIPILGQNDTNNRILYSTNMEILYNAGNNNPIQFNIPVGTPKLTLDITGLYGILSIFHIDNVKKSYFLYNTDDGPIAEFGGGGESTTFYDKWNSLNEKFDENIAKEVFTEFIELLTLCENQYLIHIDYAFGIYAYNSTLPVYKGGSTQIEMSAFIKTLIRKYKEALRTPTRLQQFLYVFASFPRLLKYFPQLEIILDELHSYIGKWFKYESIDVETPGIDNKNKLFMEILNETVKEIKLVSNKMFTFTENDDCADYLYTVYPHGFFNIEYNTLNNIEKGNNIMGVVTTITQPSQKTQQYLPKQSFPLTQFNESTPMSQYHLMAQNPRMTAATAGYINNKKVSKKRTLYNTTRNKMKRKNTIKGRKIQTRKKVKNNK
jgi:hypothetical protein